MKKTRILIIDDEISFAQLIAEFLEERNYKVDVAHSQQKALEKIAQIPDLILLDRAFHKQGGYFDGLAICQMIRSTEMFYRIPIIFLSAMTSDSSVKEGLKMGGDDYIAKPFNREVLIARIDAVLRRSRLDQKNFACDVDYVGELKNIIHSQLIDTFFQPIFFIDSLSILGFEALSRPLVSKILPNADVLFAKALEFGLYYELEMLCWKRASDKWKIYKKEEKIFLNCNSFLIEDDHFEQDFLNTSNDFIPEKTVFEITERIDIKNYDLFLNKLFQLKASGFNIAIDDVGHGFSSLELIARSRPECVKIDMSLVRDIHRDVLKQGIVESIVAFCKKGNIVSIAEGVETVEEFKKLEQLEVRAVQGYLFGRPEQEINFDHIAQQIKQYCEREQYA